MLKTVPKSPGISISVLLVIAIGGLVLFGTGAVLLLSGYANFKNTTELVLESAQFFMEELEEDVSQHVAPAQDVVEYLVQQAAAGNFDPAIKQETVLLLSGALAAAPQISRLAVWQPDSTELLLERAANGKLIFETNPNQNSDQLKEFLASIKQGGKTRWNRPVRLNKATLVTVVAPLYREGTFLGVVGAAISLRELSGLVDELRKADGPTGFILYGREHILAHRRLPDLPIAGLSQDNPLHKVAELGDPVIERFLSEPDGFSPPDKSFVVHEVEIAGKSHIVLTRTFSRFGPVPWILGVYSPSSDWDTQLSRLGRSIIGGLILLALSIIAAVFLARRIAAPVRKTALAAVKVSELDFEKIEPLPPSRITELNNQAVAFNQMLDGLKWFQTYVPRQLVRRLVHHNEIGSIKSREQELTVMFTDIVGFTSMSETKSPTEIADMLNQHFEILYQCIEAEGGTLDKYIGDAAMAFWGAPEEQPDHAVRACRAALAARKAFALAEPDQRIKIAIHTGPLIVGNIGAAGRMNYTVIGDTVNTCSRIEKLAGELASDDQTTILISDTTVAGLSDEFEHDRVGNFRVKGRRKTVSVYNLKGQSNPGR